MANALNIAGNPIKDININLHFWVQDQKLQNWPPLKIFKLNSEFRIKVVEWTPQMVYKTFTLEHTISVPDFTEVRYVFHVGLAPLIGKILNSFLSSWSKVVDGPSNGIQGIHVQPYHHFSSRLHRGKMCISCGSRTPPMIGKFFKRFLSSGSKVVEWTPSFWHLLEILEILLLHVLSNDACIFAINLFPISWEPFENVKLPFFLLQYSSVH